MGATDRTPPAPTRVAAAAVSAPLGSLYFLSVLRPCQDLRPTPSRCRCVLQVRLFNGVGERNGLTCTFVVERFEQHASADVMRPLALERALLAGGHRGTRLAPVCAQTGVFLGSPAVE